MDYHRVVLHKGWFKDTAPQFKRPLALIRADGDAYTSTMDIMTNAYKNLAIGGIVIVDDYQTYQSCRNAIVDFFKAENIPLSAIVEPGDPGTFLPMADPSGPKNTNFVRLPVSNVLNNATELSKMSARLVITIRKQNYK